MYKAMRCWVFVAIASLLLAGSLALAQGKGKGRGGKPPGWEKGEKKGWQGDLPPGIEKKDVWLPQGLTGKEEAKGKIDKAPGRGPGKRRQRERKNKRMKGKGKKR